MQFLARLAIFLIVAYFVISSLGIWWSLGIGMFCLLLAAAK
jgi:hypothetical protein